MCCKKNCDNEIKQEKKQEERLNIQYFWKNLAQKHESEKEDRKKQKQIFLESSLNRIREDLTSQKKSIEFLKQRMMSIENSLIAIQKHILETNKTNIR